jgi:hypothetical protein
MEWFLNCYDVLMFILELFKILTDYFKIWQDYFILLEDDDYRNLIEGDDV